MSLSTSTRCQIITIGDELLIGQTIDTNSAFIAQELNKIGVTVTRRVAIGDNKPDMQQSLDEALNENDIIIMTGGLGPTADDITKPFLCEYFNGQLVLNQEVLEHVNEFFKKRNRPMLERNRQQAFVPNVCEVLYNEVGTAPGMLFRRGNKLIFSLPGVPFEMKYIMLHHVVQAIQQAFHTAPLVHRNLVTSGEGESFIAERLMIFEAELPPYIKLAYLPKISLVKLRLSSTQDYEPELNLQFNKLKSILDNITVWDDEKEFEEVIYMLFTKNNKTLAIAESCTGGHIAARITSVKGSSDFFRGAIIPYQVQSKINNLGVHSSIIEQHTAVSEATAATMAENVRLQFGSDIGLSITGYLEKNDHDNEIWIGLSSADKTICKKINGPYDREKNATLAVNVALNLLRIFVKAM